MENSIEEDIKILEEFKTNGYTVLLMKYGDRIKTNFKLAKAIEHILKELKRFENMYEAEHQIHLVRNEQLDRKQKAIIKCNELENENKELEKENEELKNKVKGQECVIETQAYNEEVYERTFERLEKENKELKEEKDANYTTVYLKGIHDEREKWELKVNAQIKELKEKQKSNKNYNMADWEDNDVYTEIILNLQDLLEKRG